MKGSLKTSACKQTPLGGGRTQLPANAAKPCCWAQKNDYGSQMRSLGASLDLRLWRIPSEAPKHDQTSVISVSSSSLRIRDSRGSGTALVFLCDPPVTVEAYDELIQCFQPNFRVIVAELPGFGFSRAAKAHQLSFDGAVALVEDALLKLGLESIILFGPCICGFVATELAKRNKLPLAGVVLMQTPDKAGMLSWVERMDPKGLLRIPILGQVLLKLNALRTIEFWFRYATAKNFDSRPISTVVSTAVKQGGGYPLATMLQLWSKGTKDARINVPGLIVWGRQDRSHTATNPECSRAHLVNGEIVEMAECGHFSELEMPAEFAASVMPFIHRCLDQSDDPGGAPVSHV